MPENERAGGSPNLSPLVGAELFASGERKSNARIAYAAGGFATQAQETHCDGFLNSS
jgi:hypothetical protein